MISSAWLLSCSMLEGHPYISFENSNYRENMHSATQEMDSDQTSKKKIVRIKQIKLILFMFKSRGRIL